MSRKIVVALGGNAILSSDPSAQAQQEALVETAKHLVKLIKNGDDLIITHGNGPQVGKQGSFQSLLPSVGARGSLLEDHFRE